MALKIVADSKPNRFSIFLVILFVTSIQFFASGHRGCCNKCNCDCDCPKKCNEIDTTATTKLLDTLSTTSPSDTTTSPTTETITNPSTPTTIPTTPNTECHQQNYLCISDEYEGAENFAHICCCNTDFASLPPVVDHKRLYDPTRGFFCDNKTRVCVGKLHGRGSETFTGPENFYDFCKKYCNTTAQQFVQAPGICGMEVTDIDPCWLPTEPNKIYFYAEVSSSEWIATDIATIDSCKCNPPPINESKTEKFSMQNGTLNNPPSLTIRCDDMSKFCSLTPDGHFIRSISGEAAYIYPSCQKIRNISAHLAKEDEEGYHVCTSFVSLKFQANPTPTDLEAWFASIAVSCFGCENLLSHVESECYGEPIHH